MQTCTEWSTLCMKLYSVSGNRNNYVGKVACSPLFSSPLAMFVNIPWSGQVMGMSAASQYKKCEISIRPGAQIKDQENLNPISNQRCKGSYSHIFKPD